MGSASAIGEGLFTQAKQKLRTEPQQQSVIQYDALFFCSKMRIRLKNLGVIAMMRNVSCRLFAAASCRWGEGAERRAFRCPRPAAMPDTIGRGFHAGSGGQHGLAGRFRRAGRETLRGQPPLDGGKLRRGGVSRCKFEPGHVPENPAGADAIHAPAAGVRVHGLRKA